MGLDCTIRFASDPPSWDAIRTQLACVGGAPPLRMIDGLPAFPDETPEPGWRELRVGFAAGMVTLRRGLGALTCVVWGNAEGALRTAWEQLCWACAAAGGGTVETASGPVSANEFARTVGILPA
ncbi:MAG TPA: hypothetical protein VKE74_33970 [Gemmataceae bacterium]|nr:hypothetical protein [Gemmataceae bacterium]